MDSPYMTNEEMKELERLLTYKTSLRDSVDCWKRMRILGVSASLALSGNVSAPLIHAFDEIQKLVAEDK